MIEPISAGSKVRRLRCDAFSANASSSTVSVEVAAGAGADGFGVPFVDGVGAGFVSVAMMQTPKNEPGEKSGATCPACFQKGRFNSVASIAFAKILFLILGFFVANTKARFQWPATLAAVRRRLVETKAFVSLRCIALVRIHPATVFVGHCSLPPTKENATLRNVALTVCTVARRREITLRWVGRQNRDLRRFTRWPRFPRNSSFMSVFREHAHDGC